MKALLVAMNAKYIHSNLGVYSIRAFGLAHGIPGDALEVAEYTINQNTGEILADIYRHQPELVALSCYIWNIRQMEDLAAQLHQVLPEVPVWMGGPEVSYQAKSLLERNEWLAGVMTGEGEATFLELYRTYETGQDKASEQLAHVKGIVYRETSSGQVVITGERQKLSMDELVFPYHDMEGLKHRIVYYETSRGCPFGCSYCLSSVDKKVRLRSMSLVEKELQFFLDNKVPQVKFVDRTFNCQKEHTMAIWKYIYEHDNGITNFHFELSADLLTKEEIAYVSQFRPGLVQFEIGVQSTNPDTLRAIHRAGSLEKLKERVAKVRKGRNIHQHLDLIAGLPYEDYASFRNSFNEVYAMQPDQLQLGFLKLLKGSPIFGQQEEFTLVCQEQAPYEVLFTKWLPYEDVLRLKLVEDMVERYYNSMQFEASVPYVLQQFDSPFDFYQALGVYFQENGYLGCHQSRLQNYEILWEFCRQNTKCDENILRQLLLYDLYARENLKARPSFLAEPFSAEQKKERRELYQKKEFREKYLPAYSDYDWKQVARMTHLERFDFQVCVFLETGELQEESCLLLFDYRQRNPLSHQAAIIPIPLVV